MSYDTVNTQVCFMCIYHIGMVVGQVRLNLLDTDAYAQCFRALFEQVAADHPTLKVGKSLSAVIADWSDQQASGLEKVVGKLVGNQMLKGYQVCMHIKFD